MLFKLIAFSAAVATGAASDTAPTPAQPCNIVLKSGNKCLHRQGNNATPWWFDCPANPDALFKFDIIPADPTNPDLVKIRDSAGQYLSYQSPWQDSVMTRNLEAQYFQIWERRVTATGVRFWNVGRNAFMGAPGSNVGAWFTTDPAESNFDSSAAGLSCSDPAPGPTETPVAPTPAEPCNVVLKSGDKCLHRQGNNATPWWFDCPANPDALFKFDIIPADPTNPDLVKIKDSAGQYLSYQSPWQDGVVTRNLEAQYFQIWERRVTATGVRFWNVGRNAFMGASFSNFGAFFTTDPALANFDSSAAGLSCSDPAPGHTETTVKTQLTPTHTIETPPAPMIQRVMTKCKTFTPDRAMSIKNGADSAAVQLCKVINGNAMSPMWGNGKDSDCGTDAGLIASATNSIADCQALCDAHVKCLGWWMWDQSILPAPFTKDDQGCYLFEHGTADQLVPDRVMDSAIAAGVCFPEPTPTEAPTARTDPPTNAPVKECIVPRVGEACPQMTLKTLNRLTADQAALEANFPGTFEDCVAHVDTLFGKGAGAAKYFEVNGVTKCESWVVRNCDNFGVAPETCPTVPVPSPTAPPTTMTAPPTTSACVGYHYMINGECTGVQGFPGANGCGLANGGKDSHPIALTKAFCQEFGTARVPTDQQVPMRSWGNLGRDDAARFSGEVNDPTLPSGCVVHANQNLYQWNNAANGAATKWWKPVCMTKDQMTAPPSSPPTAPVKECIVPRVGEACPQFTLKALNRLTTAQAALEANFPGTFEDCVTHVETLFGEGAGAVKFFDENGVTKCESWVVRNCDNFGVAPATCPSGAAPAPTAPPTAVCDCRQSTETYDEGARCMDPLGSTIGYRKTANWCCSDYGCSKGYKWVNPADNKCHDDHFVGTCMFNFIQAGGCDMSTIDANPLIQQQVDADCFTCEHIGELVDQECSPGTQEPIVILNDMIEAARRLENAPLPADDSTLQKIKRKISKIRTILKQKKNAAKAAQNPFSGGR